MTPARTLTITVPGSSHRLEGRYTQTGPGTLALIAPPHPVYGGTVGNPVVRALEGALQRRGHPTLAFNFRGTGESEGEPSGEYADSLTDYLGAARALPELQLSWCSGYSFGSVAALGAAIELAVPRVLMVAPPLALLDPELLTRFQGELAVVLGSDDDYAPLEPFQELFGKRERTTIEILDGVEHFFLGSAVQRLSEALGRVLEKVDV